jgi:hypothetical protein
MDAARSLGPVLITGCSSGLGYASAVQFHKAGYLTVASIPLTGTESPYAIYKRNIGTYMLHFLRPGGFGVMSAEHVARVVLKAATVARPRTRYNVGFWARFGPIGRALTPDRVVDAYMTWEIPHR